MKLIPVPGFRHSALPALPALHADSRSPRAAGRPAQARRRGALGAERTAGPRTPLGHYLVQP